MSYIQSRKRYPGSLFQKIMAMSIDTARIFVEHSGLEPLTSTLPVLRSTR